jgi:hypothetical protein
MTSCRMTVFLRSLPLMLGAMALSQPAIPIAEAVDQHAVKAALTTGGVHLADLQNSDGGWFFTAVAPDCGAGPNVSCPDIFGVTALGLLDAFHKTRVPEVLTAAKNAGNALKAKQVAGPVCDRTSATSADEPTTSDVIFLLQLSQFTGDQSYRQAATVWFNCVLSDFPIAANRANERINRRIGLGAWDAAFDIRAALRIGTGTLRTYALAELNQVFARQGDWDVHDPHCSGCEIRSKANLLKAMTDVRNATSLIHNKVTEYLNAVLAAQDANGSWGPGDTQLTAYAILGLQTYAGSTATVKQAVNKGVTFLLSKQIPSLSGGFDDGSAEDNTEIDGEVLQALRAAYDL